MKHAISILLMSFNFLLAHKTLAFMQPPPKQHLQNSRFDQIKSAQVIQPVHANPEPISPEEVIVFALQAAVATFYIEQADLLAYKQRLQKYYSPAIIPIVEQQIIPKNGRGICTHALQTQQSFNAIANAPATITHSNHRWQVKIPMILSDQSTLLVSYSLNSPTNSLNSLVITQFDIENHEHKHVRKTH